MPTKRKKWRIKKPIIDWIKFDSWLEGDIYSSFMRWDIWNYTWVKELEWAKLISTETDKYTVVPWFKAWKKTFRNMIYTPDFIIKKKDWTIVILEVKSKWSAIKPDYRLRVKLFLSQYKDKLNFAELTNIKKWVYEYIEYF